MSQLPAVLAFKPSVMICSRCGRPFVARRGQKLVFVVLGQADPVVFCLPCAPDLADDVRRKRILAAAQRASRAAVN